MACNPCETAFRAAQPLVVTMVKSGTTALVYLQNQGRSIVHIRRMLLCYTNGTTHGILYRRPESTGWTASEYLEQGVTALYYSWTPPAGYTAEAQVEYVEIDGRSRSCAEQF